MGIEGKLTTHRATELMLEKLQQRGRAEYAALSIPVYDGQIYLAERKKDPHAGLYSIVGGKVDYKGMKALKDTKEQKTPGHFRPRLQVNGFEDPVLAAIREVCEELFVNKDLRWIEEKHAREGYNGRRKKLTIDKICESNEEYIVNNTRLDIEEEFWWSRPCDAIFDYNTGAFCSLYVIDIPEDAMPFSRSRREIGDIEVLDNLALKDVNPITRFALYQASQIDQNLKNKTGIRDIIPERFKVKPKDIQFARINSIVMPEAFVDAIAKETGEDIDLVANRFKKIRQKCLEDPRGKNRNPFYETIEKLTGEAPDIYKQMLSTTLSVKNSFFIS